MALWQATSAIGGGGQDLQSTSTTLAAQLGARVQAKDMASTAYGFGEFIYLKGLDATAVGSVVTFDRETFATTLAVADGTGPIAVAMSACLTGQYGWYQIYGTAVCKVAALFAADLVPYLTATPGTIDDAVVAGDEIYGAKSLTAIATPAAGLALVGISYPFVTNASN